MAVIWTITDHDEWLRRRALDLTASDVPAVFGVDPRRSALQVYGEKAGMIVAEDEKPIMQRGRWMEAAMLAAMQELHPEWQFQKANVYVSDRQLRLGATPDFFGQHPGRADQLVVVQGKTVSRPTFERDWSEGVPLPVQLQVLTEGLLLDAPLLKVAAFVLDTYSASLKLFDVPRHAEVEQRIRELAQTFWTNIQLGVRPAVDYARDAEVITKLLPKEEPGKVVDMSGDNLLPELLAKRATLKKQISSAEADVKFIETQVKDKLGDAERATLPGWKLTWKAETRAGYTVPEKTSRVLRISEEKEKAA